MDLEKILNKMIKNKEYHYKIPISEKETFLKQVNSLKFRNESTKRVINNVIHTEYIELFILYSMDEYI